VRGAFQRPGPRTKIWSRSNICRSSPLDSGFKVQGCFALRPSLSSLVHPRANQAHLLCGERLGRRSHRPATWRLIGSRAGGWRMASRRLTTLPARASRTSLSSRSSATALPHRRHSGLLINPGDSHHKLAFLTFPRHDDLPILAPLEHTLQAIQSQPAFGPLLPVASEAGCFKQRAHVLGVSDTFLFGSGGKFAEIGSGNQRQHHYGAGE